MCGNIQIVSNQYRSERMETLKSVNCDEVITLFRVHVLAQHNEIIKRIKKKKTNQPTTLRLLQ